MRPALAAAAHRTRARATSLSTVPPAENSEHYHPHLAAIAASILYLSPCPSNEGRRVYILNAAALPDAFEVDYDSLLAYVLARLPGEDELLSGTEYEIIFFAGGPPEGATVDKKAGPGAGWYLQVYNVLSRATRKKLQKLYIVHPRTWVKVLLSVFGTVVSPKFRRKTVHVNTLTQLAQFVSLEKLLIPPSAYQHDRKLTPEIIVPSVSGRRAFGARHPLPKNIETGQTRLPRVLREATTFVLQPENIVAEGLFRIPAHSVLSGILKEAYDRGQQFIVWKGNGATVVQPGMDPALVEEVRTEDSYTVHSATSLIKLWYRELREPVFGEQSYPYLRERFSSPDSVVTPEDLVDLILPGSPSSPLAATSQEILSRHLLPMLSEVAAHEPQNKMNADNLAICFSMCLVCGPDQMEDAKMSSILRKVLQAAIQMWPQLRLGLGIDSKAFEHDLMPPSDMRDYEDPLEEPIIATSSFNENGHRIQLDESDEESQSPSTWSRQRATSTAKHIAGAVLPRKSKPSVSETTPPQIATPPLNPGVDSPVKRKPVHSSAEILMEKLATGGVTCDSSDPEESRKVDGFKPTMSTHNSLAQAAQAVVISRKAPPIPPHSRKPSKPIVESNNVTHDKPETNSSNGNTEGPMFAKPTHPASSYKKPAPPTNINESNPIAASGLMQVPPRKLRTPSPGLLQRISSMELDNKTPKLPPPQDRNASFKKASVDDLRKIYEGK
ncbi:Rho GTPase activation protein [Piedraia hortae CBS 480.64]|uniref:Rho GTPase activation protein n=1 Tax=Piedraia hortae CBS 480.64 TaxID=1314780 RepID=A0A6A7CAQ2_9PEZI|nr:Rho GTPase activation protein [Piedraia hortae CBS 480.64]